MPGLENWDSDLLWHANSPHMYTCTTILSKISLSLPQDQLKLVVETVATILNRKLR